MADKEKRIIENRERLCFSYSRKEMQALADLLKENLDSITKEMVHSGIGSPRSKELEPTHEVVTIMLVDIEQFGIVPGGAK